MFYLSRYVALIVVMGRRQDCGIAKRQSYHTEREYFFAPRPIIFILFLHSH